jgi:hypothetical protein
VGGSCCATGLCRYISRLFLWSDTGTNDNKNNQESIFEVQYMEGSAGYNGSQIYNMLPMPLTHDEIQPIIQVSNPQDLSGEGNNAPTPDLIAAFEAGDLRKNATIGYVTASGSALTNKIIPIVRNTPSRMLYGSIPATIFRCTGMQKYY